MVARQRIIFATYGGFHIEGSDVRATTEEDCESLLTSAIWLWAGLACDRAEGLMLARIGS